METLDCNKLRRAMISLSRANEITPALRFELSEPFWVEAAFTLLVIYLNDVLQFLKNAERGIVFRDPTDEMPGSVTNFVNSMRNACCHMGSPERQLLKTPVVASFGTVYPHACALFDFPLLEGGKKVIHHNPYANDKLFFHGENRVFLEHHIWRAINEAKETLIKLAAENHVPTSGFFYSWVD